MEPRSGTPGSDSPSNEQERSQSEQWAFNSERGQLDPRQRLPLVPKCHSDCAGSWMFSVLLCLFYLLCGNWLAFHRQNKRSYHHIPLQKKDKQCPHPIQLHSWPLKYLHESNRPEQPNTKSFVTPASICKTAPLLFNERQFLMCKVQSCVIKSTKCTKHDIILYFLSNSTHRF